MDFGLKNQGTIFLQTISGIVDNITCYPTSNSDQIRLTRPPSNPLTTAWRAVVKATYHLVFHNDLDCDKHKVLTKDPKNNSQSHGSSYINDDLRYYQDDLKTL